MRRLLIGLWLIILPVAVDACLLADNHPMKKRLDSLFASGASTADHRQLKKGGFTVLRKENVNQVIVAAHPKLRGYIIKLHLDCQVGCCDEKMCASRISGARLLRDEIERCGYNPLFKVPKKWMYRLPNRTGKQKRWILLVEDMYPVQEAVNLRCWQSNKFVSGALLDALFYLADKLGMRDLVYVDNMPFCLDRKVAFIDTENHSVWPVPFKRLTGRLPEELKPHWRKLLRKGRKGPLAK